MKLLLKNGKEVKVEKIEKKTGGLSIYPEKKSVDELEELFTDEALAVVKYQTDDGVTYGRFNNMCVESILKKDGTVIVGLANKRVIATIDVAQQLNEMSDCIENMRREIDKSNGAITDIEGEIEVLENGQQTQDAAIGDLGQAVSDIAEGGGQ